MATSEDPLPSGKASEQASEQALGSVRVPFEKWTGSSARRGEDHLVVEEPIEYRIQGRPLATVMRTPGNDMDLAIGFLFSEGFIEGVKDVGALCVCGRRSGDNGPETELFDGEANIVDFIPRTGLEIDVGRPQRIGPVVSSCGVCGKRTIEEVLASIPRMTPPLKKECAAWTIEARTLAALPSRLNEQQVLFRETGALHAAGIFDSTGEARVVREDIGRHNAVDKVIGHFVRKGVPSSLERSVLVVSGRASFEIIQKSLRASIPVVVAVSGISNLAVELALEGGITLCGFTRGETFSCYSHGERIRG